jgi:hypothetical protein
VVPQGARAVEASPEGRLTTRIEIRPARWRLALGALGIIGFTVAGVTLLIYGGIVASAVGLLSIVFFGGMCGYAFIRTVRGQGRLAILDEGLEIGLPGTLGHIVPWSDIESIGVTKVASSEFTAVCLTNHRAFLDGMSDEETKVFLRLVRGLTMVGYGAVVTGGNTGLTGMLGELKDVTSPADYLAFNRRVYGAELLIGWTMRDRSATAFAAYLEEYRQNATRVR